MTEDKLSPYREDFGLLIEAGFVATKQFDEKSARDLFEAARLLEPESAAPVVGLGYIALNKLELVEAERLLKEALKMEPKHHLATAFLGLAYLLSETREEEGRRLMKKAMEETDDPTVVSLAETSLGWSKSEKEKKKKSPFFEGSK